MTDRDSRDRVTSDRARSGADGPISAADPRPSDLVSGEEDTSFDAPWQARAFAVAVVLSDHYEGAYSWSEFQRRLVEEVQSDENGKTESNESRDTQESKYYEQWLRALERLVIESEMIDANEIDQRVREFADGDRDASEFVTGEHSHTHEEGAHDHG